MNYAEEFKVWEAMRSYAVGQPLSSEGWHSLGWITMLDRNNIEFVPGCIRGAKSEEERAENERFYRSLMLDKLGEHFDFWKFKYKRREGQYLTVRVLFTGSDRGRHGINQLYLDFFKRAGEDMPALVQRAIRQATDPAYLAERRAKREAQIDYWQAKSADDDEA